MSDMDERDDRNPQYALRDVNMIDADGLWVTAFDANGMECQVNITGLTADRIRDWLNGTPVHIR